MVIETDSHMCNEVQAVKFNKELIVFRLLIVVVRQVVLGLSVSTAGLLVGHLAEFADGKLYIQRV